MASFSSFSPATATASTAQEIERTHARLKAADLATRPGETVREGELPAHLVRKEPEEADRLQTIAELTGGDGADGKLFAKPQLDQRTLDYYQRKLKDAEFVDREKWIADHFDLTKPADAAWFDRIMPSYLQRRQDFGMAKLAMQKQLFDISLRGPKSEEDIDFLYALETGKINLKELERPVWKAPELEDLGIQYQRGLLASASPFEGGERAGTALDNDGKGAGYQISDRFPGGRSENAFGAGGWQARGDAPGLGGFLANRLD